MARYQTKKNANGTFTTRKSHPLAWVLLVVFMVGVIASNPWLLIPTPFVIALLVWAKKKQNREAKKDG